jgi:hypothetical protein
MSKAAVIDLLGPPEQKLKTGNFQWKFEDASLSDNWLTVTLIVHFDAKEYVETAIVLDGEERFPTVDNFPSGNSNLRNYHAEVRADSNR